MGSGLERERAYQAERARALGEVTRTPGAVVERYRRSRRWRLVPKECLFHFLGDPSGLRVLDFGCGEGELTTQLAALGARVTGIDVSEALLAVARRRAELDGVEDRVELRGGDVLRMTGLPARGFDAVVCSAVLHHVALEPVFERLLELARPGGRIVIQEPVAFSHHLQRVRDALPVEKDVSPGERQLSRSDVDWLIARLREPRARFFHLTARLARLLPHRETFEDDYALSRAAVYALLGLDQALMTAVPPLRRFAGIVVLAGTRP